MKQTEKGSGRGFDSRLVHHSVIVCKYFADTMLKMQKPVSGLSKTVVILQIMPQYLNGSKPAKSIFSLIMMGQPWFRQGSE